MDINLDQDVKISLTFANNKLIVPMIVVYDSKTKKSLIQLSITFYHDDFLVERISYDTKCMYIYIYVLHLYNDYYNYSLDGHRPLNDAVSHSSLTGFEILFKWEGEQVIFIIH
jgi:hypothetical protein